MTNRLYLTASAIILALYVAGYWLTRRAAVCLLASAFAIGGCHLGPRGRAAVATTTAIRALDAACTAFLADDGTAYVDGAVTACAPVADPVGCFNGKVAAREKAIAACRGYGAARMAGAGDWTALGNEARGALSAIGVR